MSKRRNHNAAFKALGLDDCIYQPLRIGKTSLPSLISMLREGKIMGANLTHPLKEEALRYLDCLSNDAEACGSVNTLTLNGDLLVGDTTDGEGCIEALASKGISTMRERVLIIGAGGAAKAIAHSIAKRGPKRLYIINRTLRRAEGLAEALRGYENIQARPWDDMSHCLARSKIVINCTTIGMHGTKGSLPITKDDLDEAKVVMDIVYDPVSTELLREADSAGCLPINGLEMLVHQGAISFERWTGLKPPIDIMKTAIEGQLTVRDNERSHCVDRAYG